ncbi:DUF2969 domain-containing protein [Ligilactobacillus pobuzihii]|uniref:DUF2969 domain-containing protein n=1 Tax=Ligilactobacillus pobuzihii TaxID=449659 RepID=A0A0R2LNI0_9LACO|nr:DUF2969 domain-containing protein [Ligilactobacillus pobuzihii]KRK10808.1 hypothetical protein FD11_GL001474 [Ligilactobacillus pobuzihii E100301 = KCTC 13174]KRO01024.1 hypothetical protein IV66_GL001203 [Ligilactobacillus pobuzihii]
MKVKKEKNIEVIEEEKKVNGVVVSQLTLGKESLGTIQQEGKRYVVHFPSGEETHTTNKTAAIDTLIREFHLHHS